MDDNTTPPAPMSPAPAAPAVPPAPAEKQVKITAGRLKQVLGATAQAKAKIDKADALIISMAQGKSGAVASALATQIGGLGNAYRELSLVEQEVNNVLDELASL